MTEPTVAKVMPTEDCPNCHGTGRRYRFSMANPQSEDIGACPTCEGSGKIVALGVVHLAEGEQPPTPTEPVVPPVAPPVREPVPEPSAPEEPAVPVVPVG